MNVNDMRPAPRLLDVRADQREKFDTGAALVPLRCGSCPKCGETLRRNEIRQDALLRGGGYGGTRRIETDDCTCGFSRVAAVATERPPR